MAFTSLRPAVRGLGATVLLLAGRAACAQAPVAAPPLSPAPSDIGSDLAPLPDLGVAWPDPARIDAAGPAADGAAAAAATSHDRRARYRVVLEGVAPLGEAFRTRFNSLSALVVNEAKPANVAQLDRRAQDDRALVRQLLQGVGRYDGTVASTVIPETAGAPATVRLGVTPGPAYRFDAVTLPGIEAAGAQARPLAREFRVHPGDAVDADAVLAAVAAFKAELGRRGYPFAALADPQVIVDHAAHSARLAVAVAPGAHARFGRIVPLGTDPLFSVKHLGEIARFHPGEPYDAARLEDFRRALIATGLVSTATVTAQATPAPDVVDVAVRIDRAPPRTVAAALGYGTGEGPRAELSWQHRNFFPPEGAITLRGVGGTQEQSLGAIYRRSDYLARDHVLTAQAVFSHSNFDAYDARTITIGVGIERQTNIIWQKKWVYSIGPELVRSSERDTVIATAERQRRLFLIAALPGTLAYDGTDDLLNPSRGYRLAARISPELSLQDGTRGYARLQFDASAYQPLGDRLVLAARVRVGSIQGATRGDIAPSRRFYSGGGGSVRGYGYQKIGPLDIDGNPVGGRALSEFGTELRIRFGAFGVVPFFDGGNLYTDSVPRLSGFRYGTGLGVRYYSSFGPIRLDVGTPLDRRNGESRVALYVSLGQAF